MIQRIQSVFLLLASGSLFSTFALPFATSAEKGEGLLADKVFDIMDHPALLGLAIIGGLVAAMAIFLYNNRSLQLRLTLLTIVSAILLPIVACLLVLTESATVNDTAVYEEKLGIAMPIVAIIFSALAYRNIKKDDRLVKSMDRLR